MTCSKCGSGMYITGTICDMIFDWQGDPERDDDGWPLWAEFEIYQCLQCHEKERKFACYITSDREDPADPGRDVE